MNILWKLPLALCLSLASVNTTVAQEPNAAKGDLVQGVSFENENDLEKWSADEGNTFSRSSDYAATGNYSLKLYFPEGGKIYFKPDVSDWSGFSELRFTAHNPDQRNLRYRVIRLVDENGEHTNEGENTMPNCLIHLPPGETREVRLDLKKMPGVNLKNIKGITIFWGTENTTIYIDNIRLWTEAEVLADSNAKTRARLEEVGEQLNAVADNGYFTDEVKKIQSELAEMSKQKSDDTLLDIKKPAEKAMRLAALSAMLKDSCKPGEKVADYLLRAAYPTEKLFRDATFNSLKKISLTTAGYERESFQLAVLPARKLENIKVSASPLTLDGDDKTVIPAENITINPVGYIEVSNVFYFGLRTGFWPDPLMQPRAINLDGEFEPYWITIYTPANQKSGTYHGEITVSCDNAGEQKFSYNVRVRNFSLPVKGKLRTFFDIRQTADTPEARRALYQFYFDHRLNPNTMYGCTTSPDKMVPHADDLEFCLERGLNNINLYYTYDHNAKNPFVYSEEYIQKILDDLRPTIEILRKHNALDLATIYTCDEIAFDAPERQKLRIEEQIKLCTRLKKELPEVKLVNCGPRMDISTDLMDIFYLIAVPAKDTQDIRDAGKQTAFYWAYENPSFMLDLPGSAPRICSWLAFKEKSIGIGYYCTSRAWPGTHLDAANEPEGLEYAEPFYSAKTNTGFGRNGCGHLIYLRKDGGFNSSVRLQNIRDGVEDYEYLAMLDELSNGKAEELDIPKEIVDLQENWWAQYTTDFEKIQKIRNAVGDAIEKLSSENAKK
jgi:enamine deaminase RidA (YjgF/YER057c/UK114 family)